MRFALLLSCLLFSVSSYACPNLSGEFEFELGWNGRIMIKQSGCESIEIRLVSEHYKSDMTLFYNIDGKHYQGAEVRYLNPEFAIDHKTEGPAGPNTYDFHSASFEGDKLSIKSFSGPQRDCGLNHTFVISPCQKTEVTLHLDRSTNSIVKTQIGYGRTESGYTTDEFHTRRLR